MKISENVLWLHGFWGSRPVATALEIKNIIKGTLKASQHILEVRCFGKYILKNQGDGIWFIVLKNFESFRQCGGNHFLKRILKDSILRNIFRNPCKMILKSNSWKLSRFKWAFLAPSQLPVRLPWCERRSLSNTLI